MQIYMEKFDENNKRRMYQYDISGNRVDFKHGVTGGVLQEDYRVFEEGKNIDKPGARELRAKIKNYIFDLVLDIPWVERLELMGKIIENDRVCVVPTIEIIVEGKSIDDIMLIIDKYKQEFIEMGYEGIMIRLGDDGYQQKRSMSLLKYKDFFDEEYKVIGFDSQEHDGTKLGAVTLRFPGPGNLEFNARPAMPESEKDHIWNNADEYLNRMATVKFQGKDAQSGIPRFPVLTKFRLKDDMS